MLGIGPPAVEGRSRIGFCPADRENPRPRTEGKLEIRDGVDRNADGIGANGRNIYAQEARGYRQREKGWNKSSGAHGSVPPVVSSAFTGDHFFGEASVAPPALVHGSPNARATNTFQGISDGDIADDNIADDNIACRTT